MATAPDGSTWEVKRHWIARRPRWKGRELRDIPDVGELFSFFDDSPLGWLFALIVLVALILFFTGFLAFILEAALIVLALAVTIVAKVLFRRPWFIEAVPRGSPELTRRWAVVGWKRTTETIDEIALSLEAGTPFVSPHARELEVAGAPRERAAPKGGS